MTRQCPLRSTKGPIVFAKGRKSSFLSFCDTIERGDSDREECGRRPKADQSVLLSWSHAAPSCLTAGVQDSRVESRAFFRGIRRMRQVPEVVPGAARGPWRVNRAGGANLRLRRTSKGS